jgi:hypothetical protein
MDATKDYLGAGMRLDVGGMPTNMQNGMGQMAPAQHQAMRGDGTMRPVNSYLPVHLNQQQQQQVLKQQQELQAYEQVSIVFPSTEESFGSTPFLSGL